MKTPSLLPLLRERFPGAVLGSHAYRGDETLVLRKESLPKVARFLREDPRLRMDFLMDLTAVDYSAFQRESSAAFFESSGVSVRPDSGIPDPQPWPGPPGERFALVYHFYSLEHKHRLRLVVPVSEEEPEVPTLTSLWKGADWLEREVWDMFGIRFRGHPNLKRILMYEEFQGHPLRKDYPVNKRQPLVGPKN